MKMRFNGAFQKLRFVALELLGSPLDFDELSRVAVSRRARRQTFRLWKGQLS
jgi:hypothetical protein